MPKVVSWRKLRFRFDWTLTLAAAMCCSLGLVNLWSAVRERQFNLFAQQLSWIAGGALLFLAVSATLAPAVSYLNRRFAPAATAADPWRFFRQSAWGGLCVTICAWLQMPRSFNKGGTFIIIGTCFVSVYQNSRN